MSTPRPSPRPLVLSSQHGYDQLRRDITNGELLRVRRGVYVTDSEVRLEGWERHDRAVREMCAAVAATTTCLFAFSHETAAALLELEAPRIDKIELVQRSRPCGAMAPDVTRHYRPDLTESDIIEVDGLPVTPVARTAVDCALVSSPPAGLAIADAALRRLARCNRFDRERSIDRQDLRRAQLLEQLAERGAVRHVRRAREVLSLSNGLAEGGGESWLRWLVLVQGLPEPELQVPVRTPVTTFFTDQMWPTQITGGPKPIVGEYDGAGKYQDQPGEAVVDQIHRDELIKDAIDPTILHFTKRDRRSLSSAAARLVRAFPPDLARIPRPLLLARTSHRRRL